MESLFVRRDMPRMLDRVVLNVLRSLHDVSGLDQFSEERRNSVGFIQNVPPRLRPCSGGSKARRVESTPPTFATGSLGLTTLS